LPQAFCATQMYMDGRFLAVLLNETKNISHQPFMLRQFIF
jgi:hypothetical protein